MDVRPMGNEISPIILQKTDNNIITAKNRD